MKDYFGRVGFAAILLSVSVYFFFYCLFGGEP